VTQRTRDPSRIRAIARRAKSVDDASPWVKVFAFGPNGAGKTRLCASAPDVLILDTNEQGTRSARGSGARVIECDDWEDMADAYWWMKSGKHKYKSLAIDGLPGMHRMAMDFVTDDAEKRNPDRPSKQADKRDWGRAGSLMGGLLLAFRNLDMHVIMTSTVRTIRDDDTGDVVEITPDLPAGVRGVALGCCGIMGPMAPKQRKVRRNGKVVREVVDTMTVGYDPVYPTKDRTNVLGPVIIRPTIPMMIEAWLSNPTSEED